MRAAFVHGLGEIMAADSRVVLITADLGFSVIEPLAVRFPDRLINVGAAEQNMAGIATGLAHSGCIVFTYSIATFATLRGYEFTRNGAVVHGLPVRIVGIGGGFEYGSAGISHYALEDFAVMRVQPGMTVIAPADSAQAVAALHATWDLPGPVYYRVGKRDDADIAELGGRFRLGRLEVLSKGSEVALFSAGAMAREMLDVCRRLSARGLSCTAAVVGCLSPAPAGDIASILRHSRLAVTMESHYLTGGLGSLVAEVLAHNAIDCRLLRAGVASVPDTFSGSQRHMERHFGLDAESVVNQVVVARQGLPLAPIRFSA